MTVPSPIISTGCISSIPTVRRRNRWVTCCAGSSAPGERARNGRNGHPVPTPTRRLYALPAKKCGSPFSFAGPKRHNDPGVAFEALPPIDVVLVSHGHYDHLDVATLSKLAAKFSPRVITPLGNDVTMRSANDAIRAEAFDWHDRVELGGGIAATLVPTRHWSARGIFDRNKALWASFVVETPVGKLYIVCDSGYGDGQHFRRVAQAHGPLRLAILPIGAYEPRWFMRDQHMNPSDAIKALADCGAEQALAHHHGTFQLTDEAIDAPVIALHAALDEAKIPRERFVALKPGQMVEI
jgi:L-ascorbate metabolism protein UlaG (beta-lactamase superfamily)